MKIIPALLIWEPMCHDLTGVGTHTIKQGLYLCYGFLQSCFCWRCHTGKLPLLAGSWYPLLLKICFDFIMLNTHDIWNNCFGCELYLRCHASIDGWYSTTLVQTEITQQLLDGLLYWLFLSLQTHQTPLTKTIILACRTQELLFYCCWWVCFVSFCDFGQIQTNYSKSHKQTHWSRQR